MNRSSRSKIIALSLLTLFTHIFGWNAQSAPEERPVLVPGSESHGGKGIVCFSDLAIKEKVRTTLIANRTSTHPVDPFTPEVLDSIVKPVRLLEFVIQEESVKILGGTESPLITSTSQDFKEVFEERYNKLNSDTDKNRQALAALLRQSREALPLETAWTNDGLPEIDDARYYGIPQDPSCLVIQLAYQDRFRVYYDLRLLRKMPVLDQAGLVTHEWVYRWAISVGQNDSMATREITGFLYRKDFETLSDEEIGKKLRATVMPEYGEDFVELSLDGQRFFATAGYLNSTGEDFATKGHVFTRNVLNTLTRNRVYLPLALRPTPDAMEWNGFQLALDQRIHFARNQMHWGVAAVTSFALGQEITYQGIKIPQGARINLTRVGTEPSSQQVVVSEISHREGLIRLPSYAGIRCLTLVVNPQTQKPISCKNPSLDEVSLWRGAVVSYHTQEIDLSREGFMTLILRDYLLRLTSQNNPIQVSSGGLVTLYSDTGMPQSLTLAESVTLVKSDGKKERFKKGAILQFDRSGKVLP